MGKTRSRLRRTLLSALSGLALVALTPKAADAQVSPAGTRPAPGSLVWGGDLRQHIHCTGEGSPTVILGAGLGGTSLEWVRVQPVLSEFVRVCSFDRAGYGWSDRRVSPRTAMASALELESLLGNATVAAPYLLVGHSFAGLTMRLFAARNPQRVAAMVLIDPTHEDQFRRFDEAGFQTQTAPRGGGFVISNLESLPDNLPLPVRSLAQALARSPVTVMTLYSELRHMRLSAQQLRAQPENHDIPITVVVHDSAGHALAAEARRKAAVWLEMQRELASRSRSGRLVTASGSGHHVHLDRPDVVTAVIREQLAKLRVEAKCTTQTTSC